MGRRITIALALVLLLGVVWLVASYLSVSKGISDANARVPKPVLAELKSQNGMLSSTPTTILVLGTDGGTQPGRGDAHRSDSIMLIRTDPRKHRLAFLSIPRDLRVEIPGYGGAKINAASQLGGPALALKTVKRPHRARRQPRRLRRLRPVPRADRLGRRRRHRRSPADPREQVRLPLRDRRALPRLARAGASRRGPSTWTAVGR